MKKTIENEIRNLDKKVKWILIFGGVVLILVPILVTQLDWFFDFTATGEIGDTLGGTTAPVIGAVSALLIYFSFRAQIKANLIIQNQIDDQKTEETSKKNFEHQMERYRHLKDYINNFKLIKRNVSFAKTGISPGKNEYIGSEAISKFFNIGTPNPQNFSEMRIIISFFNLIINNFKPLKENQDSKFIFNLIEIQFYRNIWDSNEEIIIKRTENPQNTNSEIYDICFKLRKIHTELATYKEIWPD